MNKALSCSAFVKSADYFMMFYSRPTLSTTSYLVHPKYITTSCNYKSSPQGQFTSNNQTFVFINFNCHVFISLPLSFSSVCTSITLIDCGSSFLKSLSFSILSRWSLRMDISENFLPETWCLDFSYIWTKWFILLLL